MSLRFTGFSTGRNPTLTELDEFTQPDGNVVPIGRGEYLKLKKAAEIVKTTPPPGGDRGIA